MERTVSEPLGQSSAVPKIEVQDTNETPTANMGHNLNVPPRRHGRHVSFDDEADRDEYLRSKSNLDPEPGRSRWLTRTRWSRSLSPRKREDASTSGRDSADATGLENGIGQITLNDDPARQTKLSLSPNEKKVSSSKAYRSIFKRNFNPDDPETDDERRVREQIQVVLGFIKKQRIGMMTSHNAKSYLIANATVVTEVENGIDFVFHANTNTLKVADIDDNPNVNLSFQNSDTAEWVSIAGKAKISTIADDIDKYFADHLKDWEGGKTPKDIGIVSVRTRSIAYAISDNFKFIPTSTTSSGIIRGELQNTTGTIKIDEPQVKQFRRRCKHSRHRTPSRSRTE
ncbi:hypothetical protein V1525DRAFT_405720 [Lipomyces kononenkoae]|uniref:Uncharacterized protein n=1 Tax=Lipomyces kononenkoae TaxID=34357 RepID=A0ACC3T0G9_LIPKO